MKKVLPCFAILLLVFGACAQKTITDANFSATLQTNKLVILDFYATWCGPCKRMAPAIESLAREYDGRVIIGKVDVDSNTVDELNNVHAYPTLMFIKNNRIVYRHEGALPKETLTRLIEAYK